MKVGIKEISGKSGFSIATVSNVLNGKAGVNEKTAKLILKIARESGYIDSKKIKKIKLILYKKHGIILDDTPFFSILFEGIESACKENNLKLEISTLDETGSDYQVILNEIKRDTSSGIILLATEMFEEDMKKFNGITAPMVVIDNWFDDFPYDSVSTENERSAYRAVKYLIQKGHKKIGLINSTISIDNFKMRKKGYRQALKDSGLTDGFKYKIDISPTMESAYQEMKVYLQKEKDIPTAYFVINDMIALGAIKAIKEAGYKIPQDISLAAFDDLPYSAISSPGLTTVKVFKEEMGRVAVNMLMNKPGNVDTSLCTQISTSFIERESVSDIAE